LNSRLGTSLIVNVLLFRFYYFLIWAIPLLMLIIATSIRLVAMT